MGDLLANFVLYFAGVVVCTFAFYALFNLVTDKPDPNRGPGFVPAVRWHVATFVEHYPAMPPLTLAALAGLAVGAAAMAPKGLDPAAARVCTRTVATLLTTRDAVELERSRYLVAELGCSVRGALPGIEAAARDAR